MPIEASMLCTMGRETFQMFTKNTWIGDSLISCHITNNDTHLFNITVINESVQGSLGSMPAIRKRKFCIKVHQVDDTEWVHTLWPMKFCPKAGANLFSLTCKLFQGNTIKGYHKNNIMVYSSEENIILDCHIKTHDGWVVIIKSPLIKMSRKGRTSYCPPQEK